MSSGRRRQRTVPISPEEQEDMHQLQMYRDELKRVQDAKMLICEQLERVKAEGKQIEIEIRKQITANEINATRLTRLEKLQNESKHRQELLQKRRQEEEEVRRQQLQAEQIRQARSITVKPNEVELDNLEDFLVNDSMM